MLDIGDRYKLYIAIVFSIPLCWFSLLDTIKRFDTEGKKLLRGTIVRELPKAGIRPTVEMEVREPRIKVRARLQMDTFESMPRAVTFFYDGDPSQEVHCNEETNPIWLLMIATVFPITLLTLDHVMRKRHRETYEADPLFNKE